MHASYTFLPESDWEERIRAADELASSCSLCPRRCGVNRFGGEKGFCKAPGELIISSIFPHHGEEPPISGSGGSGTVFFSRCTLKCRFCQNYQISHDGEGRAYSTEEFAARLVWLQESGCHNVNFVTPSHFLPWILRGLREASRAGLTVPVVYNTSGYESLEPLALLRGVVDIYLPDMKYGDNAAADRYSQAGDYVGHNRAAIREMFRQVGPLGTDGEGIAERGMLIRHLVLPEGGAGSAEVADFLGSAFDPTDITVGVMAQYRPLHKACEHPELGRRITPDEYRAACGCFQRGGFEILCQEMPELNEAYLIDFKRRKHDRLGGN